VTKTYTSTISFFACGSAPFGIWTANKATTAYGTGGQADVALDFGFLVMSANGSGRNIGTVAGSLPITFNPGNGNPAAGQFWTALGQPGANLVKCSGKAGSAYVGGPGPHDMTIGQCSVLTVGSSGGPWLNNANGTTNGIGAVNQGCCPSNTLGGTYLGDTARSLFNWAQNQ
jgi:hypothetical protein